jgi:CelD/BcsL family acetyltransferase involved in cellulose biosynthesis
LNLLQRDFLLELVEAKTVPDFEKLKSQWNSVLLKSNNNTLFLTWEWLFTWWKHYHKDRDLNILLAKEGDNILGIAPIMLATKKIWRFKIKTVEFLGAEHTDYRDFVLTEKKSECLKLFFNYMLELNWDFLNLKFIPEETFSSHFFSSEVANKCGVTEKVAGICPYLSMNSNYEDFSKSLSGKTRKHLKSDMKKLQNEHDISFEKISDHSTLARGLKDFEYLHQQRWSSKGGMGSFRSDPKFSLFLLEVCKQLVDSNSVNLTLLKADGKPISGALCFEYNNTFYYYHQGYDPDFSGFGVGNLLILHLIKGAFDKQMVTFDFLQGDEKYKERWASNKKRTLEFSVKRNRFLPVVIDKIFNGSEFGWLQSNQRAFRLLKDTARRLLVF